jgi:2Fe-2S iron-sulfur cluster binding domain
VGEQDGWLPQRTTRNFFVGTWHGQANAIILARKVGVGCGAGLCGACTVHVNGEAVRSCQTMVGDVVGKKITTIEGLSTKGDHPLQKAWIAEQVPCRRCDRQWRACDRRRRTGSDRDRTRGGERGVQCLRRARAGLTDHGGGGEGGDEGLITPQICELQTVGGSPLAVCLKLRLFDGRLRGGFR